MSSKPEIVFSFPTTGGIEVEVNGAAGKACESMTAQFERALGLDAAKREHKPEYHRRPEVTQAARRIAGR